MNPAIAPILLASLSPRRRELLTQLGVSFEAVPVFVDETPMPGEPAEAYVQRVASAKSTAGLEASGGLRPVLAADTEVVLDGKVLGKPRDLDHAISLLMRLSGRTHRVLSAVSLRQGSNHWTASSESRVSLRTLDRREIAAYWSTGEPHDKAGGYAIQGRGALFISHLEGSYSGVMGLPLFETAQLLTHVGIDAITLLQSGRTTADE